MSKQKYDEILEEAEYLHLDVLINIARNASSLTAWKDLPDIWVHRFKSLKIVIETGKLQLAFDRKGSISRTTAVRLDHVLKFTNSRSGDKAWDWLRQLCERWAKARNVQSPQPTKNRSEL